MRRKMGRSMAGAVLCCLLSLGAAAEQKITVRAVSETAVQEDSEGPEEDSLGLYARGAVLMDGGSGRILYGKEVDTELPMASTTKIMTCILALEEGTPRMVCTASENAAAQPQVKLGMRKGDTFYLRDLLYSLMLESHNDTAVCIAEAVGGSVEGFAEKMNEKARKIGCSRTYYITPNGLDAENEGGVHHTTARELALVMRYCLTQSPRSGEFLEVTRTASYTFTNIEGTRSFSCTNHNAFLSIMEGALSGKTGFTGNAGYCYVGALEREDKLLIVSLLACGWPNHKGYKWVDTKKLMNYGLENFEKRQIIDHNIQAELIPVEKGQKENVKAEPDQAERLELLLGPKEKIETQLELSSSLTAPVGEGQQVGWVRYLLDGEAVAEYPIRTVEGVGAADLGYCLKMVWKKWLLSPL